MKCPFFLVTSELFGWPSTYTHPHLWHHLYTLMSGHQVWCRPASYFCSFFFFSPTLIHTAFFFFLIPYHNLILKQTIHTHSWVPGQQYNYKDALKPLSFQSTPLFSFTQHHHTMGFPSGSEGKESACNAGDLGSIPGLGRSPGGGHSNPLQYTCLENPHRQRNLVGYSPWRCKESGRTGQLSVSHHTIKGDVLPALQVKTVRSGDLCRCTYRHRYEYSNRNETYI